MFGIVLKNAIMLFLIIMILHFLLKNKLVEVAKTKCVVLEDETLDNHIKSNQDELLELQKYVFENEHVVKMQKEEENKNKDESVEGYAFDDDKPGRFAYL